MEKISKVLTSEEQDALLYILKDNGWDAMVKLADAIATDWSSQGMSLDLAKMEDDKVIKHVIKYNGMRAGLELFIKNVDIWKKSKIKKVDEKE